MGNLGSPRLAPEYFEKKPNFNPRPRKADKNPKGGKNDSLDETAHCMKEIGERNECVNEKYEVIERATLLMHTHSLSCQRHGWVCGMGEIDGWKEEGIRLFLAIFLFFVPNLVVLCRNPLLRCPR